MADMGTSEASEQWGVSKSTVQKWCRTGKISPKPTQDAPGCPWHISKEAIPPKRRKKGNV